MELFLIYLWLKLDVLLNVVGLLASISVVILVISLFNIGDARANIQNYRSLYDPETQQNRLEDWRPIRNKAALFGLSFLLAIVVVPSSKDTAILVGSHIAIESIKSPEGEKVGKLIRKKANEFLDEQLKEVAKK